MFPIEYVYSSPLVLLFLIFNFFFIFRALFLAFLRSRMYNSPIRRRFFLWQTAQCVFMLVVCAFFVDSSLSPAWFIREEINGARFSLRSPNFRAYKFFIHIEASTKNCTNSTLTDNYTFALSTTLKIGAKFCISFRLEHDAFPVFADRLHLYVSLRYIDAVHDRRVPRVITQCNRWKRFSTRFLWRVHCNAGNVSIHNHTLQFKPFLFVTFHFLLNKMPMFFIAQVSTKYEQKQILICEIHHKQKHICLSMMHAFIISYDLYTILILISCRKFEIPRGLFPEKALCSFKCFWTSG